MAFSLLLADDKPAIAKIISLSLPREEFAVDSVTTGKEALEFIETAPPQFLLLDVSLPYTNDGNNPEKDGLFLTRHIKTHPALKHIKIILLTNAFEPVDEAKCREFQADGVLIKPFDPSELRGRLKSLTTDEMRSRAENTAPGVGATNPRASLPSGAPSSLDFGVELGLGIVPKDSGLDMEGTAPKPRPVPGNDLSPAAIELSNFFTQEIATQASIRIQSQIGIDLPEPAIEEFPTVTTTTRTFGLEKPASTKPKPVPRAPIDLDLPDFSKAAEEWKPKHPSVESDLSQWTSRNTKSPDLFEAPPPAIYDTGDSNFEFSQDYLVRIGATSPHPIAFPPKVESSGAAIAKQPSAYANPGMPIAPAPTSPAMPSAPAAAKPAMLGTQEMEALVREEARRVCQDIVDKVAWEVIPELAENIIRRELDKVLRALDQEAPRD